MSFSVEILTRTGSPIAVPEQLVFSPLWYSATAVGGYESAEVRVDTVVDAVLTVLSYLNHTINIYNHNRTLVWHGVVDEVVVVYGAMQVGLSMRDLVNRVKVTYTETASDGTLERKTTTWAEDNESIARYGYSEQVYTQADVNTAQAEAYRDTVLATVKIPTPIIRPLSGAEPATATLSCRGEWSFLSRQLYAQVAGLLEHNTSGAAEQLLGVGYTSTQIGFSNNKITDFGNKLDAFPADTPIVISGSTSNDGTVNTDRDGADGQAYTASTISFDPTDDVHDDTAEGLGFINDYDIITIAGAATSSHNSTRFVTDAISATHITVSKPPDIELEAAGNSITITQAGYVETNTTFTDELPSASVTLTAHGVQVAQKFTLAANVTWTVNDIAIRAKKVGLPSDNLGLALYSDSSGSPGSLIEAAAIAASTVGTAMTWHKFTFGNTNSIAYGTDYWLVISRGGSNDAENYFILDMDEDTGYSGGDLKLWTGAAWVARSPDADMPFIIRGAVETTAQVDTILTDAAQYITDYDLQDASGVETNQYRVGDGSSLYEIEKLLQSGTNAGNRLLASIDTNKIVSVYQQPTSDIGRDYRILSDGTITQPTGALLERGVLPVAKWVRVQGIPEGPDHLAPLSKFFVERAEFHPERNEWVIEPPGTDSVWDTGLQLA